jgi:hypothetical protein
MALSGLQQAALGLCSSDDSRDNNCIEWLYETISALDVATREQAVAFAAECPAAAWASTEVREAGPCAG